MICCPNCGSKLELARAVGGLTARQIETLRFIADYTVEHKITPSFDEISVGIGSTSKGNVFRLVQSLEQRGFVSKVPSSARSLTITDRGWAALGVA